MRTDSLGRFEFLDPTGAADAVGYWAPWLDSLGLPALRASVDRMPMTLATPSRAAYQMRICGTVLPIDAGILIGEARDEAGLPANAVVWASWSETHVGRGAIHTQSVATVDTTDASGFFTLCGVPRETVVTLRAVGDSLASGRVSVTFIYPEQRFDIIVGRDAPTLTVRGAVKRTGDRRSPLAGATVVVLGDERHAARTDSAGNFSLRLPWRSTELQARALGFKPEGILLTPLAREMGIDDIVLEEAPPLLDSVVVSADPFQHERDGFEYRRSRATGWFLSDEVLRDLPRVSANAVSGMVPRTRAVGGGVLVELKLRRGPGFCSPRFFENGNDMGTLTGAETVAQVDLLSRAKRIEIYTANMAPPRYNDFDGCGAVVVWTR